MPKRKSRSSYSGSPRKSPRKSGGNANASTTDDGAKDEEKERPPNVTFQFEDEDDEEVSRMDIEVNPLDVLSCLDKEETSNENQVPCKIKLDIDNLSNLNNRCLQLASCGSSPLKRASPLSPTLLDNVRQLPPPSSLPVPMPAESTTDVPESNEIVPKIEEETTTSVPITEDDAAAEEPAIKRRLCNGTAASPAPSFEPPKDEESQSQLISASSDTTVDKAKPSQSQSHPSSSSLVESGGGGGVVELPKAVFRIIDGYTVPDIHFMDKDEYLKWTPKSKVDMCIDVEYELDEVDISWLKIMNKKRSNFYGLNLGEVTCEEMELLMDRLEKEHYYELQKSGLGQPAESDEDAVCCICLDGESDNSNQIIFCDMCNIPVHQDCYGVPFIPEGSWMCRRCSISPNADIQCIFCPNKDGAFKQTVDGRWAHVHCALWIPEVRFSNSSLVEPVDDIGDIPPGRWKLLCFLCKKKGVGACIQCHLRSCVAAFHPSCAQKAGLSMKMELNPRLRMSASCDKHTSEKVRDTLTEKMKTINKVFSEKKMFDPTPSIPQNRVEALTEIVTFPGKGIFIKRLVAYWKLKRKDRGGAPLIRSPETFYIPNEPYPFSPKPLIRGENRELALTCLKNMEKLRQDLEKLKKFCDLRKTESLKTKENIETTTKILELQIQYINPLHVQVINKLKEKDKKVIFAEPVSDEEAPNYSEVIKNPMDLSTMQSKVFNLEYSCLEDLEADFLLMVENCMKYNKKSTMFYKAALKMKEEGEKVFDETRLAQQKIIEEEEKRKTEEEEGRQELRDVLSSLLEKLASHDKLEIFKEPVDLTVVTDYLTMIKEPMDFSTMRKKIEDDKYLRIEDLEADFDLMIHNCFTFNEDYTEYFKEAQKLKYQGIKIFKAAKKNHALISPLPSPTKPTAPLRKGKQQIESDSEEEEDNENESSDDEDEFNNNTEDTEKTKEEFVKELLSKTLKQLISEDDNGVFLEPVSADECPDYLDEIESPMDFSKMKQNLKDDSYSSLEEMAKDYNLMLSNCKKYNGRGSVFYGIAVEMKKVGDFHFRNAKKELRKKFR